MRKLQYLAGLLSAAILIIGCTKEGPEGPVGAIGRQGIPGSRTDRVEPRVLPVTPDRRAGNYCTTSFIRLDRFAHNIWAKVAGPTPRSPTIGLVSG